MSPPDADLPRQHERGCHVRHGRTGERDMALQRTYSTRTSPPSWRRTPSHQLRNSECGAVCRTAPHFLCLMSDSSGRRIYETGEFPADRLVSRSAKAAPIRPPVSLVISSGKIRLRLDGYGKAEMRGQRGSAKDKKSGIHNFCPADPFPLIMLMAGVALTKPTSRAAKLWSSICSFLPKAETVGKRLEKLRRRETPQHDDPDGRDHLHFPSSGIRKAAALYCRYTAPRRASARSGKSLEENLAKPPNTFRLFCGAKWRQSISAAEKKQDRNALSEGGETASSGKTAEYLRCGHGNKTDWSSSGKRSCPPREKPHAHRKW